MALTVKSLQITADTPAEIRKADRAVQWLTHMSRRQTGGLFQAHSVRLNGQLCTDPWQRLRPGDTIDVHYQPGHRYTRHRPPRQLGFQIVWEDEQLIVVNKPANWLTVPSPNRESNTLIQRVADYLKRGRRRTRVHAVHRLDRGVSGLVVLAKSAEVLSALRRQFARHEPDREYLAIVAGKLVRPSGTFRSRLATNRRLQRYSTTDPAIGELAITHYRVEQRWADATLVRARLETGRRNQIRVQFAEAGHPVLGDPRYRPERARHARWRARRLALHATVLAFVHPVTGEPRRFEAPAPREFSKFIAGSQHVATSACEKGQAQ